MSVMTIMIAIDFWFTKNVAGRLMVGLLWSKTIDDEGNEEFIYECNGDESKNNICDKKIFWFS